MKVEQPLEAGLGHHVSHIEQWLLYDLTERLMELDSTQVNVQRAVQTITEAQVRVVQNSHILKKKGQRHVSSFYRPLMVINEDGINTR